MSVSRHIDDDRLDVPAEIPYLVQSVALLAGSQDAVVRLLDAEHADDGRAVLAALSRRWVAGITAGLPIRQRGDGRIVAAGILAAHILHARLDADQSDEGGSPLGSTGALAALRSADPAAGRSAARDLLMFDDDRVAGVARVLIKAGRERVAACGHLTRAVLASGGDAGFAEGWLAVHGQRLLVAAQLVRPAAVAQVDAGVPKIRVAAAAGIARGTLDRWLDAPGR